MLRRLLLAVTLVSAQAFASNVSIPDWVRQAAAQKIEVPADSMAAVLLDDEALHVQDNGETYTRYRRVVKILRPQGREEGRISVYFDHESKILSLHAWSISAKGEEYEVKEKDFLERSEFGDDLYSDIRIKMTEAPAADPGAIVALEYEQRTRPYMFQADWTFQESLPVKHAVYNISLPASWEYKATWVRHDEVKPAVAGNSYTWELHDIPAIEHERAMMPPQAALSGRMVLAYFGPSGVPPFNSWANIAKWYAGLTSDRRATTPEILATAQQLTAGKTSYLDKVSAVAAFMQGKIRYVSVQIGIGGFQPHAAGDILQRHYGDCKDKATLMSALLHQTGIDSHYVLVHTYRGVVAKEAPSALFNHAILAIDLPADADAASLSSAVTAGNGKRYLIFDPTDEFTPVGTLSSDLQENYGLLVLEGGTGELIHMPLFAPETNQLRRSAQMKLKEDGSISGEVTEVRTGGEAAGMRAYATHSTDEQRRHRMENFLGQYLAGFTLTDLKFENLQDFNHELIVKYSFSAQAYAKKAGPLLLVRPRLLGSKIPEFGLPPRKNPFSLGAVSDERDAFDIEVPPGYVIDELPNPSNIDVGFAAYSSKIESTGQVIHYSREYRVSKIQVEKDMLSQFEHLAGVISADERGSAVLKRAP